MDVQNSFPQRLKQLRECRGLSGRVLADMLGLSKNTISRYESGERTPSLDAAAAIADFFGVSLDYLAGRSDRMGEGVTVDKKAPGAEVPENVHAAEGVPIIRRGT